MGLCDLPDDILLSVVHRVYGYPRKREALLLKHKLPLAAVCRRLRFIAFPVVYDTVYDILYSDERADSFGRFRDYMRLLTNLDLVSSLGCLDLVQRVDISLGSGTDPIWDLAMAVQRLRAAREQWDAVRILRVVMDTPLKRYMASDDLAWDTYLVATALAATLPGVQQLDFGGHAYEYTVDNIGSCIAACYAGQLRALRGDCVIATVPGTVFRGLRNAKLNYTNCLHCRIIRVDPAELRSLKLEDWRIDHPWTAFSADGDESRDIWFPNLQELDLGSYGEVIASQVDDGAKPGGRLHFPALRVLKVACENGIPHVLERGVFPARMDRVVVLVTASALLGVSNMALPGARHLRLVMQPDVDYSPAASAAIKRILDSARDCDEVELAFRDDNLPAQPETLASASVTQLTAATLISFDTMVALIRCLPRLSTLVIWALNMRSIRPGSIVVPEPPPLPAAGLCWWSPSPARSNRRAFRSTATTGTKSRFPGR